MTRYRQTVFLRRFDGCSSTSWCRRSASPPSAALRRGNASALRTSPRSPAGDWGWGWATGGIPFGVVTDRLGRARDADVSRRAGRLRARNGRLVSLVGLLLSPFIVERWV